MSKQRTITNWVLSNQGSCWGGVRSGTIHFLKLPSHLIQSFSLITTLEISRECTVKTERKESGGFVASLM